MDIDYRQPWLEKVCNSSAAAVRKLGPEQAKRLRQRLDDLDAAENLEIVRSLPHHRCHELTQDRKGQLAIDLKHPYRLIIEPDHDPVPTRSDGGLDWTNVTRIRIVDILDYH